MLSMMSVLTRRERSEARDEIEGRDVATRTRVVCGCCDGVRSLICGAVALSLLAVLCSVSPWPPSRRLVLSLCSLYHYLFSSHTMLPLLPPQEATDIFSLSDQVLADRLQFIREVSSAPDISVLSPTPSLTTTALLLR